MKRQWVGMILGICLIASCAPSPVPAGNKGLVQTQSPAATARPTRAPTWTPLPMDTATPPPTPQPTATASKGEIRQQFLDELTQTIQGAKGVAKVNLVMATADGIAIDLSTHSALSYDQPPVSFAVIQALAEKVGSLKKEDLMAKLESTDVNIYLTTTSSAGVNRYGSITDWTTLTGLAKHQLSYDNWVEQASASFKR